MEARRLTNKDYFESDTISATCFHSKITDPEKQKLESLSSDREDWGAFTPSGKMAAHIINNHFVCNLNGSAVMCGGIGAVSTLPEYRSGGAIREIFKGLLPEAYERGEVISALYPFKHAFYRKFGYETATVKNHYVFRPNFLSERSFDGDVELYEGGDAGEYLKIFNALHKEYNLSIERDLEKQKKKFLYSNPLSERKYTYLMKIGGKAISYLSFEDRRNDPMARLIVHDLAWSCPEGFNAILGFLARFEADYGTIEIDLPTDINLPLLAKAPYDTESASLTCDYMVRIVNAGAALKTLAGESELIIEVRGDDILPQNNGIWRVSRGEVERYEKDADISVSVTALSQLLSGALSLKTALYRPDVKIHKKAEALYKVFAGKSAFLTEHF